MEILDLHQYTYFKEYYYFQYPEKLRQPDSEIWSVTRK